MLQQIERDDTVMIECTREEWNELAREIREMHAIIQTLGEQIGPAMEKLQSGGIMGLITGRG